MPLGVQIVIAMFAAGAIALTGPAVWRTLPEPADADEEKRSYRDVAQLRHAGLITAVAAALVAGVLAACVGRPELLASWVLYASVGSWLAWIDWHTLYLPYRLTAALYVGLWIAVVAAAAATGDGSMLVRTALANVVVYIVFWLIYLVGQRYGNALGFGDVRLAAVIAVALGPLGDWQVFSGIYAGFVLGAIGAVILRYFTAFQANKFAFGPYLWLGAVTGVAVMQ